MGLGGSLVSAITWTTGGRGPGCLSGRGDGVRRRRPSSGTRSSSGARVSGSVCPNGTRTDTDSLPEEDVAMGNGRGAGDGAGVGVGAGAGATSTCGWGDGFRDGMTTGSDGCA